MNSTDAVKTVKYSDSNRVKFAVADIDGVLRGKVLSRKKFLKTLESDFGFCDVVFGWDVNDKVYENSEVTGWHTGYPDALCTIDLHTLRKIPWAEEMPFFLADFSRSETLREVCPRTLLKRVREQCIGMGYNPQFSNEFEWFNFDETPRSLKEKNYSDPTPITPGMFGYSLLRSSQNDTYFNSLYDLMSRFDIPLEALHTETGDGVYEASIEYTDLLEAADRGVLFKTGVKEIAYKHDIIASFMAKWSNSFPGCSGHIHQSLWDEGGGANMFHDGDDEQNMSALMRHYIAGQLHCLPHILPMYAPTVNSYKRFVAGSWAATSVSWGVDNRTTAVRAIPSGKTGTHVEMRVPGADANPYLSMAASLASGLYGIRNELGLDMEPTAGNEYENSGTESLPRTLQEATDAMKSSDLPRELFGEAFTDHFVRTREWEWDQFSERVTDWELQRYFEII